MEIDKTNRSELKKYFSANKKPTEAQFAEFIDAGLNQVEDGIAKLQGSPIALQAEGDASGTQDVLSLFTSFSEDNPSWMLNLNPWATSQSDSNKPGLNIKDATGASRLFIKAGSGEVGVGTIEPNSRLTIKGKENASMLSVISDATGSTRLVELSQEAKAGILSVRSGDGTLGAKVSGLPTASSFFLSKVGVGLDNPQATLHVGGAAPELRITQSQAGAGPRLSLYQKDNKYWDVFLEDSSATLSFSPNGSADATKMVRISQGGDLQLPGGIFFKDRASHLNNDGALYQLGGKVYLTIDDHFYVRHPEGEALHVHAQQRRLKIGGTDPLAPLTISGTGKLDVPDTDLHITEGAILFGGVNNAMEKDSGKIAVGRYAEDEFNDSALSLNIFGLGITKDRRRIDVWAEGGMILNGPVKRRQAHIVVFSAYIVNSGQSGNRDLVKFENVTNNIGECFDTTTSIFTAPVRGVYMFCMTIYGAHYDGTTWQMVLNEVGTWVNGWGGGEINEKSALTTATQNATSSRTIFTVLNPGDKVWISQRAADHGRGDNYRSGWEGALLYELAD